MALAMAAKAPVVLLVIDYSTNWFNTFKGATLSNGRPIKVEQTEWKDIAVEASADAVDGSRANVYLKAAENPLDASQKEDRVISPHFVLIRNFPRSLHNIDYRNNLIAFVFANIPCMNSASSVLQAMDRPVMYGALLSLRDKHGAAKFPLISLQFHPNLHMSTQKDLIDVKFPTVIKVSSTHAGFGKMMAHNQSQYKDAESVLALTSEYYTTESFVEDITEEIRVQKIGDKYRAYLRRSDSGWKGNWGNIKFADVPMEDRFKFWADEVSQLFGGLDMFAIDVLRTGGGKEVILEVNDTAMGLYFEHEEEDKSSVRDTALARMNAALVK